MEYYTIIIIIVEIRLIGVKVPFIILLLSIMAADGLLTQGARESLTVSA